MNLLKILISLLFLVLGIFAIYYGFTRPCDLAPVTQIVQGQEVIVEQPEQMDRLVCLSSDYIAMICVLVGIAMVFPGVGGLFKGLTETSVAASEKKKSSKKKKKKK